MKGVYPPILELVGTRRGQLSPKMIMMMTPKELEHYDLVPRVPGSSRFYQHSNNPPEADVWIKQKVLNL